MAAPLSFLSIYRATPLERIDMIRCGMLASDAKRIFADIAIGQGAGINALELIDSHAQEESQHGETLSPGETERTVGFAKLVGQWEAMIEDSGDPTGCGPPGMDGALVDQSPAGLRRRPLDRARPCAGLRVLHPARPPTADPPSILQG